MRSRDARVCLADVLTAARAIRRFVEGETLESYVEDLKLRSAVERQFEIIGETLSQGRSADADLIDRIAHARSIIGFRNQLIHGYALVDDEIVWGNVELLPELEHDVQQALRAG
jgi:uncharacterized protein with HEPN domain